MQKQGIPLNLCANWDIMQIHQFHHFKQCVGKGYWNIPDANKAALLPLMYVQLPLLTLVVSKLAKIASDIVVISILFQRKLK